MSEHTDAIEIAAQKILEIARCNLVEALAGMEELIVLTRQQQHRIDTLYSVIKELERFEDK